MPRLSQEQYKPLLERGLSEERIAALAGERGYELPGGATGTLGLAVGALKGATGIAVDTAQAFQGAGQRVIAAATPLSLEEVKKTTGLKSLDTSTPTGQGVE